jgi:NADH-quinone oxidoreductase subunit J
VKIERMREGFWKHFPLAAIVGLLIILEMSAVLIGGFSVSDHPKVLGAVARVGAEISNTRELGLLMYRHYIYPLEVAAALLLVAMIAAIALTLRHRKDVKTIDPSLQVQVKSADRLVVVKMASTQAALPLQVTETSSVENKV